MNTWYIIIFSLLSMGCLVMAITNEVLYKTNDSPLDTATAVGETFSYFAVAAAAATFIIVEGGTVLAEKFLHNERMKGRAEGRAEGRVEGHAEGRVEGSAEERDRLVNWLRSQGFDVSKLPPSEDLDRTQNG